MSATMKNVRQPVNRRKCVIQSVRITRQLKDVLDKLDNRHGLKPARLVREGIEMALDRYSALLDE